jgi:hypothetical protein
MNTSHPSFDNHVDPLDEDRASTPPPPYELEDPTPQVFHSSHDPEYVELEGDVPYSVRGQRTCNPATTWDFLLMYDTLR